MKNILVTLPTEAQLIKIKSMIDFYLGDKINSFLIDYTVNCDDAFGKIAESKRKNKYDAFIFDAQGCEYYTGLLNQTNSFRESTRFSIDKFSYSDSGMLVKADDKWSKHILINDAILTSQFNDNTRRVFKLIFEIPSFYFSYGNEKGDEGIGDDARKILFEIESSVSKLFPFINIRKDYSNFKKGDLLESNIRELINSTYVFMVMNKKFIYSPYCMEELYRIIERMNYDVEKFNKHTFLITSDASEEYIESRRRQCRFNELREYWIDDLKEKTNSYIKNGCRDGKSANDIVNIIKIMEKSLPFIREGISSIIRKSFIEIKNGGYFSLLEEVNAKLTDNGYPNFYPEGHEDKIINALVGLKEYKSIVSI